MYGLKKNTQILNLSILNSIKYRRAFCVTALWFTMCGCGFFGFAFVFYFLCFKNKPHETAATLAGSYDSVSWWSMRNHSVEWGRVLSSAQKAWTFWAPTTLRAAPLSSLNSGHCVQTNCLLFLCGRDKREKNKKTFHKKLCIEVENRQKTPKSSLK